MEINSEIVEILKQVSWGINSGILKGICYDIDYAKDVESMLKHIKSTRWDNIQLNLLNQLRNELNKNYKDKFQKVWNPLVLKIRSEILPGLRIQVEEQLSKKELYDKIVIQSIMADILYIILAFTYQQYVAPHFARQLLDIYRQGCIPCGWRGTYPNGKMIIY